LQRLKAVLEEFVAGAKPLPSSPTNRAERPNLKAIAELAGISVSYAGTPRCRALIEQAAAQVGLEPRSKSSFVEVAHRVLERFRIEGKPLPRSPIHAIPPTTNYRITNSLIALEGAHICDNSIVCTMIDDAAEELGLDGDTDAGGQSASDPANGDPALAHRLQTFLATLTAQGRGLPQHCRNKGCPDFMAIAQRTGIAHLILRKSRILRTMVVDAASSLGLAPSPTPRELVDTDSWRQYSSPEAVRAGEAIQGYLEDLKRTGRKLPFNPSHPCEVNLVEVAAATGLSSVTLRSRDTIARALLAKGVDEIGLIDATSAEGMDLRLRDRTGKREVRLRALLEEFKDGLIFRMTN
jgi:hypothetical protein